MFTALLANTRRSDLSEQNRLHKQHLRARLRRLRRRIRHAACVERDHALIYRLLAGRFDRNSPQSLILRVLAHSEMRRKRRLEGLLHKLPGKVHGPLRRSALIRWRCWYAAHAPRQLIISRLKYGKN